MFNLQNNKTKTLAISALPIENEENFIELNNSILLGELDKVKNIISEISREKLNIYFMKAAEHNYTVTVKYLLENTNINVLGYNMYAFNMALEKENSEVIDYLYSIVKDFGSFQADSSMSLENLLVNAVRKKSEPLLRIFMKYVTNINTYNKAITISIHYNILDMLKIIMEDTRIPINMRNFQVTKMFKLDKKIIGTMLIARIDTFKQIMLMTMHLNNNIMRYTSQ